MKVLIVDDRPKLLCLVKELLEDSGHVVTTVMSDQNVLELEQSFDLVIRELDTFIANELELLEQTTEGLIQLMIRSVANFLKDVRVKSNLSHFQLRDQIANLEKINFIRYTFPDGVNSLKLVKIFESGKFCPPYGYLEAVSLACKKEKELEQLLNSIESWFDSSGEEEGRSILISLMDVLYLKERDEINSKDVKKTLDELVFDNHLGLVSI